jgi:hypothetical protein
MGCKSVSCEASIMKVREMRGAYGAERVDSHAATHASNRPVSQSPRSGGMSKARGEHHLRVTERSYLGPLSRYLVVNTHFNGLPEGTRTPSLLIRSHRQHPATTCNLSRVGPYRRVQVRGRSWSSVAVDVPIDVGEGARRLRALAGRMSACRAPDS